MKKIMLSLFSLILVIALVACDNLETPSNEPTTYKLTLPDEGVSANVTNFSKILKNSTITLTITEEPGYKLDKLFVNDEEVDAESLTYTFNIVRNTVIEVEFVEIEYPIIYHLDGGINNPLHQDIFTISDLPLNLHYPSKEGYNFKGWYLDSKYLIPFTNHNQLEELVIYAKFEEGLVELTNSYLYHHLNNANYMFYESGNYKANIILGDMELTGVYEINELLDVIEGHSNQVSNSGIVKSYFDGSFLYVDDESSTTKAPFYSDDISLSFLSKMILQELFEMRLNEDFGIFNVAPSSINEWFRLTLKGFKNTNSRVTGEYDDEGNIIIKVSYKDDYPYQMIYSSQMEFIFDGKDIISFKTTILNALHIHLTKTIDEVEVLDDLLLFYLQPNLDIVKVNYHDTNRVIETYIVRNLIDPLLESDYTVQFETATKTHRDNFYLEGYYIDDEFVDRFSLTHLFETDEIDIYLNWIDLPTIDYYINLYKDQLVLALSNNNGDFTYYAETDDFYIYFSNYDMSVIYDKNSDEFSFYNNNSNKYYNKIDGYELPSLSDYLNSSFDYYIDFEVLLGTLYKSDLTNLKITTLSNYIGLGHLNEFTLGSDISEEERINILAHANNLYLNISEKEDLEVSISLDVTSLLNIRDAGETKVNVHYNYYYNKILKLKDLVGATYEITINEWEETFIHVSYMDMEFQLRPQNIFDGMKELAIYVNYNLYIVPINSEPLLAFEFRNAEDLVFYYNGIKVESSYELALLNVSERFFSITMDGKIKDFIDIYDEIINNGLIEIDQYIGLSYEIFDKKMFTSNMYYIQEEDKFIYYNEDFSYYYYLNYEQMEFFNQYYYNQLLLLDHFFNSEFEVLSQDNYNVILSNGITVTIYQNSITIVWDELGLMYGLELRFGDLNKRKPIDVTIDLITVNLKTEFYEEYIIYKGYTAKGLDNNPITSNISNGYLLALYRDEEYMNRFYLTEDITEGLILYLNYYTW